jgi:predicted DNA-binding transcriptional regulator AlpA
VKLLNREQLAEKGLPNSKSHIWRACHNPDAELPFPQPIHIGRNTFWVEEEIDRYIAALIAKRDGQKVSAPPVGESRADGKTDHHYAAHHAATDKRRLL